MTLPRTPAGDKSSRRRLVAGRWREATVFAESVSLRSRKRRQASFI